MDKTDLIVNLLKEGRKDQKSMVKDISEMKIDVALNRQDLEDHMEQTRAVKELTVVTKEELLKIIEAIEKKHNDHMKLMEDDIKTINKKLSIGYLLKLVVTVASGVGIVAGAIYGVIKIAQSVG